MIIVHGNGQTEYGPGVSIRLTGEEVAEAITAFLTAHFVRVEGARTITVNEQLCEAGQVYVDPSGFVIDPNGQRFSGRGWARGRE